MLKYIVFFILQTSIAFCQHERPMESLFDTQDYPRGKYFMQLSKERKAYWFNKYVKEVGVDTTSGNIMERVENAIYFVDFNHDSFPDIVDESNNGSSPVIIYLTYQDTFRKIIENDESTLREIRYLSGKTEIITQTIGMVDDFQGEAVYLLSNDSINLVKHRTRRLCTIPPQTYFKTPLSIQTLKSDTPLRENPIIGKGECFMDNGDKEYNLLDNILERFKKHKKGFAWGELHDINGQKWWLVEILSIEYPQHRGYMVGWVKATDVEVMY
jgi:hypothetical protein